MNSDLFVFAGEKSGDLHGGNLLRAFNPNLKVEGIGGSEMRAQGLKGILRTEDFEVMGFSDVVASLPKLVRQFFQVRDYLLQKKPRGVVLIDYPGFNLRMARSLRKHGYKGKIVQYISPTFWAWGKGRVQQMEQTLDLLLSIFPFEVEQLKDSPLKALYVGNPIRESVQTHDYYNDWKQLLGVKSDEVVALFPGSRKGEIHRNLPLQLEAAHKLKQKHPEVVFGVSCAHSEIMPVMHQILRRNPLKLNRDIFLIPKAYTYELMRDSRSAIAKAGSVTVELALHNTPTVVMYKLSLLNRLYAQFILRLNLPHYCMVNILSDKRIFPELIAEGLNPNNLFQEIDRLHTNNDARAACIAGCSLLDSILQENDSSAQAARAIEELLV